MLRRLHQPSNANISFNLSRLTTQNCTRIKHLRSQPYSTPSTFLLANNEVAATMPYNRDEVIASVTEFYVFLTTHLHFYPSELKTPPPAGWPQITSSRFAVQRKSETVIDLLRHLPYLPGGNDADRFIHDLTVCADYTIESVGLDNELSIPEIAEHCPWDKLKDLSRREHIVTLGFPKTVRSIGRELCDDLQFKC